ncbi:MAG: hypothetical protein WCA08_18840 [Desulfoferrobacter sp.]
MLKKIVKVLMVALVVLSLAAPVAFADPVKGEVVAVEGGTYTVKDYNGKEYKITEDLAAGLNLQTGDLVEMELQEAQPVKVKKAEK